MDIHVERENNFELSWHLQGQGDCQAGAPTDLRHVLQAANLLEGLAEGFWLLNNDMPLSGTHPLMLTLTFSI